MIIDCTMMLLDSTPMCSRLSLCLQVTQELLDKVGEVEARLQFQERMNHLSNWVHLTQQPLSVRTELSLSDAQVSYGSLRSCITIS